MRRGRTHRTTTPDETTARRLTWWIVTSAQRPNQLWVADLTYVATWSGFVYVALVINAFSRFIVGWQAARSLRTDLALDALEMAIGAADPAGGAVASLGQGQPTWDKGSSQHRLLLTGSTMRWPRRSSGCTRPSWSAGVAPGGASTTSSTPPWEWVDWFNHRRLLEPIGYVLPAEFEAAFRNRRTPLSKPREQTWLS